MLGKNQPLGSEEFLSLTVSGVNLLAGDEHSNVTMDRHVQA